MLLIEIAALFFAIWALRRTRRVDSLEARLRELEFQVSFLRRSAAPTGIATEAVAVEEAVAEEHLAPAAPIEAEEPEAAVEPPFDASPPPAYEPPSPEPQRVASEPAFAQIDWERWLGVRGAAVLGGVVLALAAIFFFRYSIEHGLIPPWLRVVAGTVTGVGCIVASERYLRQRYAGTADALAGAGVVVLYATTWAARVLYELIGTPAAFVLMIAVTVTCCALSWSHASLVVAMLGLIGGFATPFMLDSGVDNPIGLFAYVFLLDAALLYLARRQRWPLLALFSLAATTLYQASWIFGRMDDGRTGLGLEILAVSSLLFTIASRRAPDGDRLEWIATQAAGLLLPFAFVMVLSANVLLTPSLIPLALLIGVIDAAACWIGAVQHRPWLGAAAAVATIAVVGVWTANHTLLPAVAWEVAIVSVLLAAVFHAAVELKRESAGTEGPAPAAMIAAMGFFWLLIVVQGWQGHSLESGYSLWPWLAGGLGLAAILVRHATFPERAWLQAVAGGALALVLTQASLVAGAATGWSVCIAVGLLAQAVALSRRDPKVRVWADHAAALFAALCLLGLTRATETPLPVSFSMAIAFGIFIALAAARLGRGEWLLAAVLLTAWCHLYLSLSAPVADNAGTLLAIELGAVLLFAAFPFVVPRRFAGDAFAWPAAALAAPLWFISLRHLYLLVFGSESIGLLAVGLGGVAAAQGWRARDLWGIADPIRPRNLVWFFVVAVGFLTAAIPLQLEKEWITIGWALEGLGVLLLWRRFDVVWLKYFAMSLLAGVTIRLIANPAVLGYYPRPPWRILNWLLYSYLVPAAALFASAYVLRPLEATRLRDWETRVYAGGNAARPIAATAAGFAGVVVVFVWINLAIVDWFATGETLRVSLDRLPARDLAMSICWALYALLLLAGGVRLRSVGARWLSLGLMIVTIAKVFLYDLGELRDLYRVASLLGLALSLIAVSLAYQRFVLKSATEET